MVYLNERKPAGLENMGDCAGIALRAAELYQAAKSWQEEITKVTMLSNRGGKRRGDGYPGESDGGSQATVVDVEKVHRLAKDPVLLKVRIFGCEHWKSYLFSMGILIFFKQCRSTCHERVRSQR